MQPRGNSVNSTNLELFSAFIQHTPTAVAMLDCNLCYLLASQKWLSDYALEDQNLTGCPIELLPLYHRQQGLLELGEWELETKQADETEVWVPPLCGSEEFFASTHKLVPQWQEFYVLAKSGKPQNGDSDYVIRPDGSLQRLKWEIQPWYNSSGEIGGIIIFTEFQKDSFQLVQDNYHCIREQASYGIWGTASLTVAVEQLQEEISQRQYAQALEQASEKRYRALVAAMAEGIILQDASNIICTCNAAAAQILGFAADGLQGKNALDTRWRAIKENGEPFSIEEHPLNVSLQTGQALHNAVMGIHKPNGSLVWVNINSQPLFLPNGTTPYAVVASLTDVTNRKQFEAALRESEERFRATFEQAAVGITHATTLGYFTRVNQKFCDIVGYSRQELLAKTFYDITHPDDLCLDREYVRSLFAGEIETYTLEKCYLHKNGQSVWVQITASLVQPILGTAPYFLAVVQDIGTRKKAEYALKQSEAQLRESLARESLLNRISTQIRNSLELNTILKTAVQEIRKMLQIDRCQFAWYQTDGWQVVQSACHPNLAGIENSQEAEAVGLLLQQLVQMEILQIDDLNALDNPIYRDVCELGYKSILILPMLAPNGTIGVISCLHTSSIRPWNVAEVELLKAVQDQLLIAIKQAELYGASCKATELAQEQAMQLEQTLYELQRTQAQLIQVEKMSGLGQLVAGVAHEINNPVNFIYGNLIYVQEYSQDLLGLLQLYRAAYPLPSMVIKERIDAIDLDFLMTDFARLQDSMKLGAERIREIVRSLRIFSRLDESECKEIDIHSGIDSTLMILQHRFKAKLSYPEINLIKNYGDLPLIQCYAGQLNQVFMNLLTNALDALEEKMSQQNRMAMNNECKAMAFSLPTITITTGISGRTNSLRLDGQKNNDVQAANLKDDYAFIRITDNGTGMSEKTQQQLFNPFFTTKPVGKGTGLGLAISYQIVVERHGGLLDCNSMPGEGAEFVVKIPIKQH
jgi:PAS domain S-box-containing protein